MLFTRNNRSENRALPCCTFFFFRIMRTLSSLKIMIKNYVLGLIWLRFLFMQLELTNLRSRFVLIALKIKKSCASKGFLPCWWKLPKLEVEFARDKFGADVGGGAALAVSAWRISSHCVVLCVVVLVFSSCSLIVWRWVVDRWLRVSDTRDADDPGLSLSWGCSATEASRDPLPCVVLWVECRPVRPFFESLFRAS